MSLGSEVPPSLFPTHFVFAVMRLLIIPFALALVPILVPLAPPYPDLNIQNLRYLFGYLPTLGCLSLGACVPIYVVLLQLPRRIPDFSPWLFTVKFVWTLIPYIGFVISAYLIFMHFGVFPIPLEQFIFSTIPYGFFVIIPSTIVVVRKFKHIIPTIPQMMGKINNYSGLFPLFFNFCQLFLILAVRFRTYQITILVIFQFFAQAYKLLMRRVVFGLAKVLEIDDTLLHDIRLVSAFWLEFTSCLFVAFVFPTVTQITLVIVYYVIQGVVLAGMVGLDSNFLRMYISNQIWDARVIQQQQQQANQTQRAWGPPPEKVPSVRVLTTVEDNLETSVAVLEDVTPPSPLATSSRHKFQSPLEPEPSQYNSEYPTKMWRWLDPITTQEARERATISFLLSCIAQVAGKMAYIGISPILYYLYNKQYYTIFASLPNEQFINSLYYAVVGMGLVTLQTAITVQLFWHFYKVNVYYVTLQFIQRQYFFLSCIMMCGFLFPLVPLLEHNSIISWAMSV